MSCARIARWMIGFALAAGAAPVSAKVGPTSLAHLAMYSDHVVVARATSMVQDASGRDWARIDVLETWKGHPPAGVEVLASPTWTCDTSTAVMGETALFFLYDAKTAGRCIIAHDGRGRMPASTDGAWFRAWISDVVMPAGIPTQPVDGDAASIDAWVDAAAMKRFVREAALAPAPRNSRASALRWLVLLVVTALSVRYFVMRRRAMRAQPA